MQTVTATTINTGTLSLTHESNPFISFKLANKGIHSVPKVALNLVVETQNDLCPASAITFDLGLPGARWRDTLTRRLVTDRVATSGSRLALSVYDWDTGASADLFTVDSAGMLPVGNKDIG